jgi:predicted ATPase
VRGLQLNVAITVAGASVIASPHVAAGKTLPWSSPQPTATRWLAHLEVRHIGAASDLLTIFTDGSLPGAALWMLCRASARQPGTTQPVMAPTGEGRP